MKTQHYWIDTLKNSCQSCHALGSKGVRTLSKDLGNFENSTDAWTRRVQSGQAMSNMAATLSRFGAQQALSRFADWTDRVAAGELPAEKPPRPQGLERNVVISTWEWGSQKHYLHDAISTDKRNPTVNADGLIYGSPEESTDLVPILDPVHNTATEIKHPYRDPKTRPRRTCRSARRSIGATIRSGTAIPASTTRSWTRRAGSGSRRG
jgi:hypothetical protein